LTGLSSTDHDASMGVFVIFRTTKIDLLKDALEREFPGDHLMVSPGEFLVSSPGTAQYVSDKLGLTGNGRSVGSGIIVRIHDYYGRASAEIWDWIRTKAEASGG